MKPTNTHVSSPESGRFAHVYARPVDAYLMLAALVLLVAAVLADLFS